MSQGSKFLIAGVMGWPVMHSRSPKLHNFWLQQYGLAGTYVPLEIKQDQLEQALRALPVLNFAGCNLTIPHKEAAAHAGVSKGREEGRRRRWAGFRRWAGNEVG